MIGRCNSQQSYNLSVGKLICVTEGSGVNVRVQHTNLGYDVTKTSDAGGSCDFYIYSSGNYTITATKGTQTRTITANVIAGMIKVVEIKFELVLLNGKNILVPFTYYMTGVDGTYSGRQVPTVSATVYDNYECTEVSTPSGGCIWYASNPIDLTNYTKITYLLRGANQKNNQCGVWDATGISSGYGPQTVRATTGCPNENNTWYTRETNITNLTGNYYVGLFQYCATNWIRKIVLS